MHQENYDDDDDMKGKLSRVFKKIKKEVKDSISTKNKFNVGVHLYSKQKHFEKA